MNKLKKYFPFLYTAFLIIGFLYIRNVLNQDLITVDKADTVKKQVEDIKPVNVYLNVVSQSQNSTYRLKKENNDTFDDFLEDLVDNNVLTYEKTEYTYGTNYDKINGETAPEGYVWKVYAGEKDITYNTRGVKLEDNVTYKFVLTRK